MDLDHYREQLDFIDNKILQLLEERMTIIQFIKLIKQDQGLPIHDVGCEIFTINKLEKQEKYKGIVKTIWPAIIDFAKSIEIRKN